MFVQGPHITQPTQIIKNRTSLIKRTKRSVACLVGVDVNAQGEIE